MAVTSDIHGASRLTPGGGGSRGDRVFSVMVAVAAACTPLLLIAIFILLLPCASRHARLDRLDLHRDHRVF